VATCSSKDGGGAEDGAEVVGEETFAKEDDVAVTMVADDFEGSITISSVARWLTVVV
jgi:hypothetical protein